MDEISRTSTNSSDSHIPFIEGFNFDDDNIELEFDWKANNRNTGFGIGPVGYNFGYHTTFGTGGEPTKVSSYIGNSNGSESAMRHNDIVAWNTNTYYHFKMQRISGTVTYYINGTLVRTENNRSYLNDYTNTIVWGEWSSGTTSTVKNLKLKPTTTS